MAYQIGKMASRRLALAVLLYVGPQVHAQFLTPGLATTDDGATLYFGREPKYVSGPPGFIPSKIFIADATGVRVYADEIPGFGGGYVVYMGTPAVSGDGSVVAYSGWYNTAVIYGVSSWSFVDFYRTLIGINGGPPMAVDLGIPHVSSNGRYVAFSDPNYPMLVDLGTGQRVPIPINYTGPSGPNIVSSDGTVLLGPNCSLPVA